MQVPSAARTALRRGATLSVKRTPSSTTLSGPKRAFSLSRDPLPRNPGFLIVPQQSVWVVERFGRFQSLLEPGIHFRIPIVDRVAYTQSLKETVVDIPHQNAITKDNVQLSINGVLYLQVYDAFKASYNVEDAYKQSSQLAQTSMRSEIGKLTLDEIFSERVSLNQRIVDAIDAAAEDWGIKALRYEIKDITPSDTVLATMESQSVAERRRREVILDAEGDAEALKIEVQANADAIRMVGKVMEGNSLGYDAGALRIADEYIKTFGNISEHAKTVLLPGQGDGKGSGDVNSLAQAAAVFQSLNKGAGEQAPYPVYGRHPGLGAGEERYDDDDDALYEHDREERPDVDFRTYEDTFMPPK
eukprot:TRINITY_DN11246_c0_g1_i1.p1 TRINITY_DN11246_c0_g1~~TRINITY_DN11246_c0_g1_i1.p1  ORF type:complete len:359 (-),score=54.60 TRINITY_DN11246_c0_g1_i1:36-1112(-)